MIAFAFGLFVGLGSALGVVVWAYCAALKIYLC
jgi:hypothetical protein